MFASVAKRMKGVGPLLLWGVLTTSAPALDIDFTLVGYSFLPVTSSEVTPEGLILTMRDGSTRRVDLTYAVLVGTDGNITKPCILHQHWLRMTYAGGRGSLVCTSWPILLAVGFCLVLDVLLLIRYFRRRTRPRESDQGAPSPR